MAELQQVVDPEDSAAMPIDLDIDENTLDISVQETVVEDDLPFAEEPAVEPEQVEAEPLPEPELEPELEPEPEPEPEIEPEPEPEPEPDGEEADDDDDDLPLFSDPKPLFEAAIDSPKTKRAVIDVMTDKEAWRTDMVGTPVRDLLSAISLNDRVQFINVLFQGDPVIFQQTRAKINTMTSLDEVVEYVTSNFNWDMGSQVVYRFMMAVRRKVQA
jgi:hypothetical protein